MTHHRESIEKKPTPRPVSRRRFLWTAGTAGGMGGLAGCNFGGLIGSDTGQNTTLPAPPDDPYRVEFALALAGPHNAVFDLSVKRRDIGVSAYSELTPVHLRVQEGIQIHRLLPSMEKNELEEAGLELAIGVGSDLTPVSGLALGVTIVEVMNKVQDKLNRSPTHATFEPKTVGEQVKYLVWLRADDAVQNWAQPKTKLWYEFATPADKTIRHRDLSPIHWPVCGETQQPEETSTPTETPTEAARPNGDWPMFQANLANTGHANTTGVRSPIQEQWRFKTGGRVVDPAVISGITYVGSYDRHVYALSAANGVEQWRFETEFQVTGSPAVVDGTIYVIDGDIEAIPDGNGGVYALSAADGTEQWRFDAGNVVFSSPAVANGIVYFGSIDGRVYALSAANGTERWHFQTDSSVSSSPAVVDDTIYVGSEDRSIYALDAREGTEQWHFQTDGMVLSSPVVVDGTVYFGSTDGRVYALSADDGTEQWRFGAANLGPASPAVADGMVYIGTWGAAEEDHYLYALSADDGTEQWSFGIGDTGTSSSSAVVDGTVYFGSDDHNLYALSAADGTEQWRFKADDNIRSSPAIVDGTVYVGSSDQYIYALTEDQS